MYEVGESLADYDSSEWKLLRIIYHHSYSTFNVALKARNKAVKEDTIVATDVDTDYTKPRNRKPPKLSFEKSKVKNLVEGVCLKKFPKVQISVFEDHMKRWFNTSMQRSD
ncbi:uncharacterized protein [Temnothorax longispinosus]|uniref:Uncharacterized protein n=1 Tax=Temnothorax longispinosus TaxID=300112 RepID=A0A4S2KP87_9HYME|nr:hypothetical protein DBV15_11721 [Temnothorax longispinosus]